MTIERLNRSMEDTSAGLTEQVADQALTDEGKLRHHEDFEVDSICSELEHTELTDEETSALLNDALELNKRLKAELRRQEHQDEQKLSRDGTRNKAAGFDNRGRSVGMSKRGDAKSASLPPIHPNKGLSHNQRRIHNSMEFRDHVKKTNSKPAPVMQRKTQSADRQASQRPASSGSVRRVIQSAESKQRPEWNDRFSY
ncbi:uncharacterized protein LOC117295850 [Asterias rubens]|uniref:uncharacterized protein LOC117295850 n=1 Tax=Asterias rubens TaxID=7604 RepID=UPI0014558336|nr:uncharacterized protein LOC117295850 [Asterias rubens]